jgi:hypothetical protein
MRTPVSIGLTMRAASTIELFRETAVATQVSAHDFRNEGQPRRDLIPDEQVGLAGEESAAREPVPCPVGYGGRRLTSAVCWEYARKLFAGQAFWLVTGLQSVVCKSIAKASKVRILHLPPRVREGL